MDIGVWNVLRGYGLDVTTPEFAKMMDMQDPLRKFRDRFSYPKNGSLDGTSKSLVDPQEECVYLSGNACGLQPKVATNILQENMSQWANNPVRYNAVSQSCDEDSCAHLAHLVGAAEPSSVTLMNGLTVNLHLLMLSFYKPTQDRFKILIEKNAFSSDRYAVLSQAALRGYNPAQVIVEIDPRPGEDYIRNKDIIKILEQQGSSIALVCLPGIQFYTGQKLDMQRITAAAHTQGCMVGWDLAHAIANVELQLDHWGVDFAVWCSSKYLCGGLGSIGGAYLHPKHCRPGVATLYGWWGCSQENRAKMLQQFPNEGGVNTFKLTSPSPLLVALVNCSLEILNEAGMGNLIKKQYLLTGYLELLLDTYFPNAASASSSAAATQSILRIITPNDTQQRGCQLSISFTVDAEEVHKQLMRRGVCVTTSICNPTMPTVLRVAPSPLYNSFRDVYKFVTALQEISRTCNFSCAE
ncbi:unnamed protein product [Meganyctiphanes norvegica]|uniref:Kynureninase n=1 Tax=Meganyctiphanes norvegica TaxID=48144 RepID=A0AAV2QRP4_MEGNR